MLFTRHESCSSAESYMCTDVRRSEFFRRHAQQFSLVVLHILATWQIAIFSKRKQGKKASRFSDDESIGNVERHEEMYYICEYVYKEKSFGFLERGAQKFCHSSLWTRNSFGTDGAKCERRSNG